MTDRQLLIGGAVAGGMLLAYKLANLSRLQNELEVVTKLSFGKVSLTGVELKVDATLKNPTAGTITVKYPFVKITYKDTTLASSTAKDENFPIPQYSQIALPTVTIPVSWTTLLESAPQVYSDYRAGKKITLTVKTVTTLNNTIPYTKAEDCTL